MKKVKPYWIPVIGPIVWTLFIGPYFARKQMFFPLRPIVGVTILAFYASIYCIFIVYNSWYLKKYGLY